MLSPDEVVIACDPEQEARRQNAIEAMATLAATIPYEPWQLVINTMMAFDDGKGRGVML